MNNEQHTTTIEEHGADNKYANALASKLSHRLDELLIIAESYREKYDNAKSALARDLYKKKLVKAVSQIDFYMNLVQGTESND